MRRRARLSDKPRETARADAPADAQLEPLKPSQPTKRRFRPWLALLRRLTGLVAQGILVGLIAVGIFVVVTPRLGAYITPQSYVYGDAATAVLIQWSEDNGHMDGAIQIATVDEPDQIIRAQYSAFTGVHNGSRVSITFSDLQADVQTVEGTMGWRSLRLELPQSGGRIVAIPLQAGDLTDYTHAVQAIQRAHPGLEIQGN